MNNTNIIEDYIISGAKPDKKMGLELEHFVYDDDFNIIKQEEVDEILLKASKLLGGELKTENNHDIELVLPDYTITFEPGLQLEISIKPCESVNEIKKIYTGFRDVFDKLLAEKNYKLRSFAMLPLIQNGDYSIDDVKLIDKKRYKYMNEYFLDKGKFAKYMMRATCATQVSVDFENESDAINKIQLFEKLSPFLSLIMENQSEYGVDYNKFKPHLLRTQIWQNVDSDRCGYIEDSLSESFNIKKYADNVLNKPFIIDHRDDSLVYEDRKTGNEFYANSNVNPEYYLSMFFFNVRLKKYIEIRYCDSNDVDKVLAYATLIKEIAYNKEKFNKIKELLSFIKNEKQIVDIDNEIIKDGYKAKIFDREVLDIIIDILYIVKDGLSNEDLELLNPLLDTQIINGIYRKKYVDFSNAEVSSFDNLKKYLKESPIGFYYSKKVEAYYLPKIYTKNDIKKFNNIVTEFFEILNKIISIYKTDEYCRKLFGFDEKLEKLILNSESIYVDVPMSRIDLFFDEETKNYKFCEINTDGSSSMIEDRVLNEALKLTNSYDRFVKDYNVSTFEMFDSWVDSFLKYYEAYAKKHNLNSTPNVVICDFLDKGITAEFEVFKTHFEKKNIKTEICDISELKYIDGSLYTNSNMKIDAIYRRAVTSDIMNNYEAVTDFIKAVIDKKVCLIGDFHTQVIHNKKIFYVLHNEYIQSKLSIRQKEFIKHHVPFTFLLNDENINNDRERYEDILNNKSRYIIKPTDSYASKGVFAGTELDDESWKKYVEESINKDYIVEEFAKIYYSENLKEFNSDRKFTVHSNLTNLYCYMQKFAGILSRSSESTVINMKNNELSIPTIVFDGIK